MNNYWLELVALEKELKKDATIQLQSLIGTTFTKEEALLAATDPRIIKIIRDVAQIKSPGFGFFVESLDLYEIEYSIKLDFETTAESSVAILSKLTLQSLFLQEKLS